MVDRTVPGDVIFDQIFGKAMMSKILKSNIEEDDALVNKLTDVRFKALYEEMGFGENGGPATRSAGVSGAGFEHAPASADAQPSGPPSPGAPHAIS